MSFFFNFGPLMAKKDKIQILYLHGKSYLINLVTAMDGIYDGQRPNITFSSVYQPRFSLLVAQKTYEFHQMLRFLIV